MTVYSCYNIKCDYKRVISVTCCFKIEIIIVAVKTVTAESHHTTVTAPHEEFHFFT